jgi:hypothetical protein
MGSGGVIVDGEIRSLVSRYLNQEIRIDEFQVGFAGLYLRVRSSGSRSGQAAKLCNQIVLPLAEFSREHRSESSLRQKLKAMVLQEPVVRVAPAQWISSQGTVLEDCIVFGTRTGGNSTTIIRPSAYEGCPLWHSENSTRTWNRPSLRPV